MNLPALYIFPHVPKEDTTPPVTKMNLLMLVISIYIHLLTIPIFPLLCKEG